MDFDVHVDHLQPEIIEPAAPEPLYQPAPEPEIIEQVIEPQMKPGVRVQPTQPRPAPQPKPAAPVVSDLKRKLDELVGTAQNLYAIEKKEADPDASGLEILGANNDTLTITYQIGLIENGVSIKKTETEKATGEEIVNDLTFVQDTNRQSVQTILDDVLLFDEKQDLINEPKKKMQVVEKLNKFIFLLGEQVKKAEKEAKEKEEAESERRRLQDIFRNF